MKTTISFLAALVLAVILGFNLTTENSMAALQVTSHDDCIITGLTTARGNGPSDVICAYDANNNQIACDPADRWGYFIIGGLAKGQTYRLVCTQPTGCTKTINNVSCGAQVDFRPLPSKCY